MSEQKSSVVVSDFLNHVGLELALLFIATVVLFLFRNKISNGLTLRNSLACFTAAFLSIALWSFLKDRAATGFTSGILGFACLFFLHIDKIKKFTMQVSGVDVETHGVPEELKPEIEKQVKKPEANESPETSIEEEVKEEVTEQALTKDTALPPFEESDNTFSDLMRAGYLYKDIKLVEKSLKRHAAEDGWDEEVSETFLARFLQNTGLGDGIAKLKQLEETHHDWLMPSMSLADFYIDSKAFDRALEKVELYIKRAKEHDQILTGELKKAHVLLLKGEKSKALETLQAQERKVTDTEGQKRIFSSLADYYKAEDDKISEGYYLEAVLKINPEDKDIRFRLAFLYSGMPEPLMAMFHYSILVRQDSTYGAAYNNLGVSYGGLNLRFKQIEAWKSGFSNSESYPAANLAITLAGKGFIVEAEEYLDKLSDEQKKEGRVIEARTFIEEKREEEKNIFEVAEKAANRLHGFYEQQSEFQIQKNERVFWSLAELRGAWVDNDKVLKLENVEGAMVGVLTTSSKRYSVSIKKTGLMVLLNCKQTGRKPVSGGLSGALMGLGGVFSAVPEAVDKDGWVNTETEKRATLLGGLGDTLQLKLFLSSANTLEGYELKTHTEQEYHKFVRT